MLTSCVLSPSDGIATRGACPRFIPATPPYSLQHHLTHGGCEVLALAQARCTNSSGPSLPTPNPESKRIARLAKPWSCCSVKWTQALRQFHEIRLVPLEYVYYDKLSAATNGVAMKPLVSDQLRTGMATAAGHAMKVAQCAVMAALPMGNVLAQPAPVTACDILTAHPDDANRVAEPVPFNERDAARAVPACEEAVRQHRNQPRLRYQLGLAYDSARRHTESFSSYQQAANADYTAAGFALGWAYANGEGTPRDDAAAIRWYQWAAERGHSAAQNTLGFMYENGRGVTASLPQAADWYRRAHEAGRPIGSANYGRMLALGHGGPAGTTPALRRT